MNENTISRNYLFGKEMEIADFADGGKGDTVSNYVEKKIEGVVENVSDFDAVNSAEKGTILSRTCTVQETDTNMCYGVNKIDSTVDNGLTTIFDEFDEVTGQVKSKPECSVSTTDVTIEQFREVSESRYLLNTDSSSDTINASNLFRILPLASCYDEEDSHSEISSQIIKGRNDDMSSTDDGESAIEKYLRQYTANVDLVVDEVTSSDVVELFANLDLFEYDRASEMTDEESDSQMDLKLTVDWDCVYSDIDMNNESDSECDLVGENQHDCRRELPIKGISLDADRGLSRVYEADPIQHTQANTSNPNIEDLSPEVLLLIFSYLSAQDLHENVSRVCSKWSELSDRPCLRRQLRLHGSLPTCSEVCDLLHSYPNLHTLEIEERNDLCEILCQVSVTNQRLCCLIIKRCWNPLQYDVVSDGVWKKLFSGCPRLSSLTIKKSPFSGFFEVFHPVKEHLGQLKRLNLNFVSGLESAEDVRLIVENCPHLEDFRALTRPAFNAYLFYVVQDIDVRLLTSRLSATLKVLKLEGDGLTDEGVESITCCLHLRKLCLRRVGNVTDAGLLELTRLEELTALELVDVPQPSAEGWKQLFRRCSWDCLHTLLLARCINIDDDALVWAAAACRGLKRFCIAGCYLTTSKGLKVMFRACPLIEELILCLSQTRGCIFWIPTWVPRIKKILYHSCYRLRFDQNAKDEYLLIKKVFRKKHPNLDVSYIECLNDLMVVS